MHTINENMELSFGAHHAQKTSPRLAPIAHTYTHISLQGTSAHSARANLPLSAG